VRAPPILDRVDEEAVSPVLGPLLTAVYGEVQLPQCDLASLKAALRALLNFLASYEGRTNANCVAADAFFARNDLWERDWDHLPEDFQDVLGLLGDALHDTVSAPAIAENFENTPEQLLERVARLRVCAAAV